MGNFTYLIRLRSPSKMPGCSNRSVMVANICRHFRDAWWKYRNRKGLYIARELHDEAGQALTSLMLGLRQLEQDGGDRQTGYCSQPGIKTDC